MHWVDVYAEKLLAEGKEHIIESGTSISGQPHLGSAMDIIFADGICKAIDQMGGSSRSVWAMDDTDGLRKIPPQLPDDFKQYLGQPAFKLPCPEGCHESFVDHFTVPLLKSLEKIGVRPEPVSVAKMYADGKYDDMVRTALEKAPEIRSILKEISGSERDDDWLPFFPICEKCGRILTTVAYEFDGQHVHYRCSGGVAGKADIPGCGHEGKVGLREGKLPWRVEWAARWSHLGVTCEPMGKDLATAGGTYETSKVICERIFGSKAPMPVPYEWINMGGKRLEKSAGRILTLEEFLKIATPEMVRFFFFRVQPTTHKDIDFEMGIPKLAEDYEGAEKVYFGMTEGVPEKEIEDIKRTYVISQVGAVLDAPAQVSYSHLISILQTNIDVDGNIDWSGVENTLKRTDGIDALNNGARYKGEVVKNWLDNFAPENVKFSIQKEIPVVNFDADEKRFINALLGKLANIEWEPESIHDTIYTTSQDCEMKAGKCFTALYKAFLGKDRGPRLGYLLASLDRDFVLGRIREAGT